MKLEPASQFGAARLELVRTITNCEGCRTAMIDAIVAVRKPYDDRAREADTQKANDDAQKDPAFRTLPADAQEKRLSTPR